MLLSKFYGSDSIRRRKLQDFGGAIFLPRNEKALPAMNRQRSNLY